MAKTVNLGGQEFVPNKDLEKQQKAASKRVQQIIKNVKKAEESLCALWLNTSGKRNGVRQRKKIIKVVTPWEEAKEAGKTYESTFIFMNGGAQKNSEMFSLSVVQSETGLRINFETEETENGFSERAKVALQKIKF